VPNAAKREACQRGITVWKAVEIMQKHIPLGGGQIPSKCAMRRRKSSRPIAVASSGAIGLLAGWCGHAARAADTPNYYVGATTGDLGTGSNWSLNSVPVITNDAVFPQNSAAGIRTLSSGNLTVGSLDTLATTGAFGIQDTSASNYTITLGGSGDLGNSVTMGQPNDLIYVTSGSTLNLYGNNGNGSTGVLGVVLGQNGNFNIAGTSNIGAVISDGGNGYGFTLSGGGNLSLSAANTFTGATTIAAGTLQLNFADATYTAAAPTTNIISSTSPLVFNGSGALNLTGKAGGNNAQTFASTTLNGFGNVTLVAGNSTSHILLNLGAITRNAGGGINITQPTGDTTIGATNGATTTTANNAAGILGGWATVNNTDFATNNSTNIVAYANYTALPTTGGSATTIYNGGNVTLTGNLSVDAIKFTTSGTTTLGANNLTLNGNNGGILAVANETIDTTGGGILSAGSGTELILGGNSTLTIAGNNLIGANSGSLTKIGPNTVVISGANSYTGGTNLAAGTITVGGNSSLGSGTIYLGGGTLNVSGSSTLTLTNYMVAKAGTSSTFSPAGGNLTLSGALTGSGNLLLNTGTATAANLFVSGDVSQYTGTLTANTVTSGITIGGTTAADNNLGQATLQVTGAVTTHRLAVAGGVLQVGALESAPGVGTLVNGNYSVGALNTNTSFGSAGTGGSTQTITKVGTGTLTMNTSNPSPASGTSAWNFNANNGTLIIDESNLASPTDIYNGPTAGTTGALGVGGGTFTLLEKVVSGTGTATTQGFTATTVNAGYSAITASQNNASNTPGVLLQLGPITHNHGGAVNFINPGGTLGSTNGITTTTGNATITISGNATSVGILGGYATVGGVAFAVSGNSSTAPITALSTYNQTWSSGNVSVGDAVTTDNDTETGSASLSQATAINSLTINDTGNDTLNIGNHSLTFNDAGAGGLLYAGNGSGGGSYAINGTGTLGAGSGHEFIVNVNTGATLTINTPIIGSNSGFLTTAGNGTLVLTTASFFTSPSFVNGGTLEISADADLGTGNATTGLLKMNGATLELAANYNSNSGTLFSAQGNANNGITLGNDGGTINTNGNNVSYGGNITGGVVNSTSANTAGGFNLSKAGLGTLTLTGNNTYGGATIITGGVLSVNNLNATETANGGVASSIGEAPNTAPYLVLNGGTLQYIGTTAAATDRQFTLGTSGGAIDSSSGNASYTLTWNGNTGSAGTAVNAVALPGSGTRTLTLTGNNTGENTFAMILGDSGAGATSLAKSGTGTWVLTNANGYSGGTTIAAGTLFANNATSSLGTGVVNVNGGTLAGNGAIANGSNALTVNAGGTIAAGGNATAIGKLTTGSQTWNGNGTYAWKIGAAGSAGAAPGSGASGSLAGGNGTEGSSWDNLVMSALTLNSTTTGSPFYVSLSGNPSGASVGTYSWVIAQTTATSASSINGNITAGDNLLSQGSNSADAGLFALNTTNFTFNGVSSPSQSLFSLEFETVNGGSNLDLVLDYSSAPEPGTGLLVLGGGLPMLLRRRRRGAAPECERNA
jgi:fibronectin-binding autotransporter adhesin